MVTENQRTTTLGKRGTNWPCRGIHVSHRHSEKTLREDLGEVRMQLVRAEVWGSLLPFQEGAESSWMSKSGMRKQGNQAPLLREASLQAPGAGGREAACEQVSQKRQNHREGGELPARGALGSPCPGSAPSSGKESKAQSQRSRASPAIRNSPPIPAVTVLIL